MLRIATQLGASAVNNESAYPSNPPPPLAFASSNDRTLLSPQQIVFYITACPTERGACLEVTLQSKGLAGNYNDNARSYGGSDGGTDCSILSLYAVQAHARPSHLSSYSWASREKTRHRLLLSWKGRPMSSIQEESVTQGDAKPVRIASPRKTMLPSAPIHIAVVCPELASPPAPVLGDVVGLSSENKAKACADDEMDAKRVEAGFGISEGEADRREIGVMYTVGVRTVGPPRVVLEGRYVRSSKTLSLFTGAESELREVIFR